MPAPVTNRQQNPFEDHAVRVTALVLELLDHRVNGQFREAERVQRELRDLGVQFTFRRPRPSAKPADEVLP